MTIVTLPRPTAALLVGPEHVDLVKLTIASSAYVQVSPSVDRAVLDVRRGKVHALIVSSSHLQNGARKKVAEIVARYPDTALIGLITEGHRETMLQAALDFGAVGARTVVHYDGNLRGIRETLFDVPAVDPFLLGAMHEIIDAGASPGWHRFVAACFDLENVTAKTVARALGMSHSTMMSRFYRAALPSPKRYLESIRSIAVAHVFDAPGSTIEDAACRVGFASPQSLGRHFRMQFRLTLHELRAQYTARTWFDRIRAELLDAHRETIASFDPIAPTTVRVSHTPVEQTGGGVIAMRHNGRIRRVA